MRILTNSKLGMEMPFARELVYFSSSGLVFLKILNLRT